MKRVNYMFKRAGFRLVLFLGDMVVIFIALKIASWLRPYLAFGKPIPAAEAWPEWPVVALALTTWAISFLLLDVYNLQKNLRYIDEFQRLIFAQAVATLAFAGALYFSFRDVSRLQVITFALLSLAGLLLFRSTFRLFLRSFGSQRYGARRVLIVGAGDTGRQVAEMVIKNSWTGLKLTGFLDDNPQADTLGYPHFGPLEQCLTIAQVQRVNEIIFTLPRYAHAKLANLVAQLEPLKVNVRVMPNFMDLVFLRSEVENLSDRRMRYTRSPPNPGRSMMIRVALALCLLALLSLHASGAAAETSRLVHVHGADGAYFRTERGPASPALAGAPLDLRDELLWQHNIAGFMYTSCAIADARVFAGLNNGTSCPAEYHLEDWDGLPDWTFTGGENYVTAGAGYLALVEALPAIAGVRLHVWQAGDPPTPLWEKDIPNCSAPLNCLRIAEAGNLLALAVNTAASSKTFALDPLTGDLLSSYTAPAGEFARALRVTDDGSRIALRNGAVMHALDAATGAVLWTASAGASSDALAFSPDGQYIAAGWTFLFVWEWNGSSYQFKWSHNSGATGWYLGTCALSGSGELIAGWYKTTYNQNKVTWYHTATGNTRCGPTCRRCPTASTRTCRWPAPSASAARPA